MKATRRQAREWAIQMLTAADLNPPKDMAKFLDDFWIQIRSLPDIDGGSDGWAVKGRLREFAETRFNGVSAAIDEIDKALEPYLENWLMFRLGTVERAVLRMAAWELNETTIPTPIIINEAIDLANWYASPKARSLVNSVLDRYAKSLEPARSERVEAAASAEKREKSKTREAPSIPDATSER